VKKVLLLTLGAPIHTIVSTDVDANRAEKPEELRIAKKAKLYKIKTVEVNELKSRLGAGGEKVVIINGGANELSLPSNTGLITEVSQFDGSEGKKNYFADAKAAVEVANTSNEAEIIRLKTVKASIEEQLKVLADACVENKNVLAQYKSVEDED